MLYYVPIETMEQRYTKMMNDVISPLVDFVIYPEFEYPQVIEKWQFLDINKTSIFKAKQLEMIAKLFYEWKVKDWDKFLIADIFFPWIESIKYMAELQDIRVKIYWYNHAWRADINDFVQKLWIWADYSEKAYHLACDFIFVWSEYHRKLISKYFWIDKSKIFVCWPAWDIDYVSKILDNNDIQKEDFIIMPQRLSKEKWIEKFFEFAKKCDKKIVITSSWNKTDIELPANVEYVYWLTKREYYEYMKKARRYISFAYQETFWYTLQEAIYYKCNILVPDRVCYPEMVPEENIYKSYDSILWMLEKDLVIPMSYTEQRDKNYVKMIDFINNH